MRLRPARRLGVLTTTVLLAVGLLAPSVASAAPSGVAATLGERGSVLADGSVRTATSQPIGVRDLSDACPQGRVPAAGFRDVASNYSFARAIDCLVWYGVTQGKTATTFAPNDSVTRQQMAVFLYRTLEYLEIADMVEPPRRSQFQDVPATGEVGRAVNVLASEDLEDWLGVQIVAGKTATTFDPKGHVTRAQMASFIARTLEGVAELHGATIDRGRCDNVFTDEGRIPAAHRDNVKLLCAFGVVTGRTDGSYGPQLDVTRGQMAAFLMRTMDVLVEARVALPPDAYVDVFVDRGTAATACSDAGRDGTPTKPFCSIQAGIDHARSLAGYAVTVQVRPRGHAYTGPVLLSSGRAFAVDLVTATEDRLVRLDGSIRVNGAGTDAVNVVYGFHVVSTGAPALDVRSAGLVFVIDNAFTAPTAVSVDQTGLTWLFDAAVDGESVGVDLVRTTLDADGWGTEIGFTEFGAVTSAYVRVPAGTTSSVANANLGYWRDDYDNTFATATRIATIDGRRAIVPA